MHEIKQKRQTGREKKIEDQSCAFPPPLYGRTDEAPPLSPPPYLPSPLFTK